MLKDSTLSLLTSFETLLLKRSHWPGFVWGAGWLQGHVHSTVNHRDSSPNSWPASFVPQFPPLCAAPTAAPQNDCSLAWSWSLPYEPSTGTREPNTLPTVRFICAYVGHSYLRAAPWPLFPPWQAWHPSRSCVQAPSPGLWQGCTGPQDSDRGGAGAVLHAPAARGKLL